MPGSFEARRGSWVPITLEAGVTWDELLNVPILIYFFFNGQLRVPENLIQVVGGLCTAAFWLATLFAVYRYRGRIHWELWTFRLAFVFLAYTVVSVSWGNAPLSAATYPVIWAVLTFFYCSYLVGHFRLNDFIRLTVWSMGLMLSLSVLAAVAFPAFGLDNGAADPNNLGAWQGIFSQKNQLGIATAIGMGVSLGFRPRTNFDHVWRVVVMASALLCAYGSESREAWIAILLQISAAVFAKLLSAIQPRSRLPIVLFGLFAFFGALSVVYFNLDAVLGLLGRSPTASGRTGIWRDSLMLINRRPWLGYGTYGVWRTPVAWPVVVREGWNVPSSHNNYIEILLYYGIVGMALFLPILLWGFVCMFLALLGERLRDLQVLLYVILGILALSVASPLIVYYPAIAMLMLVYSVSHLEAGVFGRLRGRQRRGT